MKIRLFSGNKLQFTSYCLFLTYIKFVNITLLSEITIKIKQKSNKVSNYKGRERQIYHFIPICCKALSSNSYMFIFLHMHRPVYEDMVKARCILEFKLIQLFRFTDEEIKSQHSHFHIAFPSKHQPVLSNVVFFFLSLESL